MTTTPLRTESQRDRNWLSLNRDTVVFRAGTDTEEHYPNDQIDPGSLNLVPDEPKAWESALKLSGRQNTHLTDLRVAQCKENALDVNWSENCTLEGNWGVVGTEGEQIITIKGGSHDITVAGRVWSRGKRADVVLGLWADQSFDTTRNVDLSWLWPGDERIMANCHLTVILCRVNQPWRAWVLGSAPKDIALPPGAKVLRLKSLGAQIHWWAKWAGVKTGLIKGRKQS